MVAKRKWKFKYYGNFLARVKFTLYLCTIQSVISLLIKVINSPKCLFKVSFFNWFNDQSVFLKG